MPSRKLMSLLEQLSKHELNRFRKYLESPYFSENGTLVHLFDVIDKHLRSRSSKQLEKKDVWKKLFGKKPYKDSRLRRLTSELNKHANHFLAMQAYRDDPMLEIDLLLPIMEERQLGKHFNGVVRSARHIQKKSGKEDADYHFHAAQVEQYLHIHEEARTRKLEELPHFERADYHLDCYYLSRKLKHYCDTLDYKKFSTLEVNIHLPDGFLGYVKSSPYLEEPSIQAYYLVAQMLLHPDAENHYRNLKKYLQEQGDKFSPSELNTLYIYLKNYCIDTKINKGRQDYFQELFDIYRTLLKKNIMLNNGVLDPQDYKNIITVGLHAEEFNWVEKFIQDQTEHLPPENQENALNYNLAKLYFHQEKYEQVIEQLREVEYKNLSYALGGKLMLLKTYYELDEYLVMDSLIESFRIYLRRNRTISKEVRQQYLNVLSFVKQLSKVLPGDKKAIKKIREEIKNTKDLADKQWILEKVGELN